MEDPQPSTSASPTHAKNYFYGIVVSTTPVKSPRKSPSPSRELEAADDEQEALTDEDWTDIESVASGRESLLPPVIVKHTGVCKDLATARAREYLMAGKGAIESANNLKREIRAIAVEQLSNLYEMVLSLADSRNRHKLLREEEKCRSAKWSGWNAPTTNNSWKKDSERQTPRCCCARQRKPGPVPIRR